MAKKKHKTIVLVNIPREYAAAHEAAWCRAKQLCWHLPSLLLEALKPMIVGVYMQGALDGYSVRARERSDHA